MKEHTTHFDGCECYESRIRVDTLNKFIKWIDCSPFADSNIQYVVEQFLKEIL